MSKNAMLMFLQKMAQFLISANILVCTPQQTHCCTWKISFTARNSSKIQTMVSSFWGHWTHKWLNDSTSFPFHWDRKETVLLPIFTSNLTCRPALYAICQQEKRAKQGELANMSKDRAGKTVSQDDSCFVRFTRHYLISQRDNNRKEGLSTARGSQASHLDKAESAAVFKVLIK